MADARGSIRMRPPPISGGSTPEAELAAAPRVAWPARAESLESPLAQGVRRFRRSTTALVGVAIVLVLVLVAIFADALAPRDPIASDQARTFERPSWDYPLGTDQLGRDMLSRVIHGSRISLAVGVSSVLFALLLGVPLGMLAGYTGGWVDTLVMRVMDLILAFPIYLLAGLSCDPDRIERLAQSVGQSPLQMRAAYAQARARELEHHALFELGIDRLGRG